LFFRRVERKEVLSARLSLKEDARRALAAARENGGEAENIVYIPMAWYCRFTTFTTPGPIDTYASLCEHGAIAGDRKTAEASHVPIPLEVFNRLHAQFSGGQPIRSLEPCSKCWDWILAYNHRKHIEYDIIQQYDSRDMGEGACWYLVDNRWVTRWKKYVRSPDAQNIDSMCAPGPVTNARLLEGENLKLSTDYIGVNGRVWFAFMFLHGGGPAVCRDKLNLSAGEMTPDRNLIPPELVPRSYTRQLTEEDESRHRATWQFVDRCKADWDLYSSVFLKDDQPMPSA
jgi:hypothetical protein